MKLNIQIHFMSQCIVYCTLPSQCKRVILVQGVVAIKKIRRQGHCLKQNNYQKLTEKQFFGFFYVTQNEIR